MFLLGKLEIKEALEAYCRVLKFSSKYLSEGARQATIKV